MLCCCCQTEGAEGDEVELEPSRTCYASVTQTRIERILEDPIQDPNAPIPLCRGCAIDHHQFWDDVWAEYYSGLL